MNAIKMLYFMVTIAILFLAACSGSEKGEDPLLIYADINETGSNDEIKDQQEQYCDTNEFPALGPFASQDGLYQIPRFTGNA